MSNQRRQDLLRVLCSGKSSTGRRRPSSSTNIYSQQDKPVLLPLVESGQFTSRAFGNKIRAAGPLPSFGSVGDGLGNAMMESFWSSMQIELLNRKKWNTRVELAIEIFRNRQRRHSAALGYRTPIEYELLFEKNTIPA